MDITSNSTLYPVADCLLIEFQQVRDLLNGEEGLLHEIVPIE